MHNIELSESSTSWMTRLEMNYCVPNKSEFYHSLDSVYAPNYCWKIYWCKFLWRISIKLKNLLGKSKIKLSTCFDWVLNPIETFTVQSYFKNIEKQVFEISLQSFKVLDQSKIQILMLSKLTIIWPFV